MSDTELDLAKLRSRNKVLMNENRALKRERDELVESMRQIYCLVSARWKRLDAGEGG